MNDVSNPDGWVYVDEVTRVIGITVRAEGNQVTLTLPPTEAIRLATQLCTAANRLLFPAGRMPVPGVRLQNGEQPWVEIPDLTVPTVRPAVPGPDAEMDPDEIDDLTPDSYMPWEDATWD